MEFSDTPHRPLDPSSAPLSRRLRFEGGQGIYRESKKLRRKAYGHLISVNPFLWMGAMGRRMYFKGRSKVFDREFPCRYTWGHGLPRFHLQEASPVPSRPLPPVRSRRLKFSEGAAPWISCHRSHACPCSPPMCDGVAPNHYPQSKIHNSPHCLGRRKSPIRIKIQKGEMGDVPKCWHGTNPYSCGGRVPFRAGRGLSEQGYLKKNTSTSVFSEKGEEER
jgi:hypothetical protein